MLSGAWTSVKNFFGGEDTPEEKAQKKKDNRAKEINSNQQYVLAWSMPLYIDYYNRKHKEDYPPEHYTSIVGRNVQRTRSHLFGIQGMEQFVNLDNAKMSALVPRVRLFQETRGKGGAIEKSVELVFDDYQTTDSILTDRGMRGSGAGIKSVSVDMEGDNIATSSRMYKVKLDLHFTSLEEIFKKRKSPSWTGAGNGEYSYVELFKIPQAVGSTKEEKIELVKMEYGFYPPTNARILGEKERNTIQEAKRVLTLNLYKHNLDYNENGSVNLSLEYHGYTERRATKIDVFDLGLSPEERRKLRDIQGGIDDKTKENAANQSPVSKSQKQQEQEQEELDKENEKAADLRKKGYESFIAKVIKDKKVYAVVHRTAENFPVLVPDYKDKVPGRLPSKLDVCFVEPSKIREWYKNLDVVDLDGEEEEVIQFFYLGDLIDSIIELAKDYPEFKKGVDFSFGSFMVPNIRGGEPYEVPISAIPISQKGFADWFKENVLEKGERTAYSLIDFLTDITKLALVSFSPAALANTSGHAPSAPGLRAQSFYTSSPIVKGEMKEVWNYITADQLKNGLETKNLTENYFFYGVNTLVEEGYSGNQETDAQNGIYWLVAASEHGITKKIKYSKSDTKFLTEARMTSDGFSDKKRIPWALYKANVEMFGNPIFSPGMVVYITSNAFNQQDAEDLGLSGYFMVLKVRNSIQDGKFKTELETVWTKPTKSNKTTKGKTGPQ